MITFEDMIKGRKELLEILDTIDEDPAIEAELTRLLQVPSPVECYAGASRLIYENRADLDVTLLNWGARAGATCAVNGFYSMTDEGVVIYDELLILAPHPVVEA
jgi:hypothetical protein